MNGQSYNEKLAETTEKLREALENLWIQVKQFLRQFFQWFQRNLAARIAKVGIEEYRRRARIFMSTKSKRVKRKQWKILFPGGVKA